MKNKGIYTQRLLKFAQHLEGKELNDSYIAPALIANNGINLIHGDNGHYHQIFPFIVYELPKVFPQ